MEEIPLVPKEQFFFQGLAVAQLPVLPVVYGNALHQLLVHAGLKARVIFHDKFIFLRVGDL
jgi:hypothetical protein